MRENTSSGMLEPACVITRLRDEIREALRELCDSPSAYISGAFALENGGTSRAMLLRLGFAFGLLCYAAAFLLMLMLSWGVHSKDRTFENPLIITWTPLYEPPPLAPDGRDTGGGGGGGGGREEETPPSVGQLPVSSRNPIVAPAPEVQTHPPHLPAIEAIILDPENGIIRDDLIPTGAPNGVVSPPSAGPGANGGIGSGLNGGVGPGDGPGVGPGANGGTGGGPFGHGGPRRVALKQPSVDTFPVLLNDPRPLYTEEARKNKSQGVVKARILVNETGGVSEVVVTRGLPDGLTEQAILAAYQMRFRPAMKNGHPVSYWVANLEIEFNLR